MVEVDRSKHSVCKLESALRLIRGDEVHVSRLAFAMVPSRFDRVLQMGNSLSTLLLSDIGGSTLVSGETLAYISGDVEYFADHIFTRAFHFLVCGQPFFVLPQADAANSISAITGCDPRPSPTLRLSSQCVVIMTAGFHGEAAVFRLGSCDDGRAEILRQIRGIAVAASDLEFRGFAPRLLTDSRVADLQISIETKLPGKVLSFTWSRVDAVADLWLSSKPATSVPARPNLYHELTRVCDALSLYRDLLCPLRDALLEWHSATALPAGTAHGDLWLGNVLFTADAVSGIVDWEWAQNDGLPLLDLLHLLFMSHAASQQASAAHYFRQAWSDALADVELNNRLRQLRHHFNLDANDMKFAILLLWFDYLYQRVVRGRMPSLAWTEDMIPRTNPEITKWLIRAHRGARETIA